MKKTLIVDDEDSARLLERIYLNDIGIYDTAEADDAYKAIDYLQQHEDTLLVIMDTQMPRAYGYEVCKQIKDAYKVPVIGMSTSSRYKQQWYDNGADCFIDKKVMEDAVTLKDTIEKVLVDFYKK